MRRASAALLLLSLVVAGCSGDDEDPAPADGVDFVDPEGEYTLTIDPAWDDQTGAEFAPPGVEYWLVAGSADGFGPNVNILTQRSPGLSMEEYVAVSREQLAGLGDLDVQREEIDDLGDGETRGTLEYSGLANGLDMGFGAVVVAYDGTYQLATLTAPSDVFDELWAEIEPYLRTLRAQR